MKIFKDEINISEIELDRVTPKGLYNQVLNQLDKDNKKRALFFDHNRIKKPLCTEFILNLDLEDCYVMKKVIKLLCF